MTDDFSDDALAFEQWKDGVWKAYFARHGTAVGFPEHLHQLIEADPEVARLFRGSLKFQSPGGQLQ
jgi:hypothetical protein